MLNLSRKLYSVGADTLSWDVKGKLFYSSLNKNPPGSILHDVQQTACPHTHIRHFFQRLNLVKREWRKKLNN